jgi:predicted O-linked N-acetylglucosamine transferase (SPINDLY family)
VVATLRRARGLHASGQLEAAAGLYAEVLRRAPEQPDALHLMGVIELQRGRSERAFELMSRSLELEPRGAQAHANLGSACMALRRPAEALAHYDQALELDPRLGGVHNNRGTVLQLLGRHSEAAAAFAQLLEFAPQASYALGNLYHARRNSCDWHDACALEQRIVEGIDRGARVDRPFTFLSVADDPARQLHCARVFAAEAYPPAPSPLWHGERYTHERIRVAYVSADFRDHIVAYLIAGVIEGHDRRRFEVLGVSLSPPDGSEIAARITRGVDELVPAWELSDEQVARQIHSREVDIVVDLTGHTQGGRLGILAHRPAPVQISYLGFPATLGVPYVDYILAEDFVIPDSMRGFYAEQPVYLPDTFQANDARRMLLTDPQAVTRSGAGLPERALVLCCFNNTYKLNPAFLDIWMRLLKAAPGSVLWLLAPDEAAQANIRRESAARGVAPERIHFAARVGYAEHLSRLALADLFLDTLPFNGGATVSDALWVGTPVLTCAGQAFAARMAGSLLRAAGLPELITPTLEDYERLALELLRDPPRLAGARAGLLARRGSAPLFDTERLCRHLSAAYEMMWERAQRGEPPRGFAVPVIPGGDLSARARKPPDR